MAMGVSVVLSERLFTAAFKGEAFTLPTKLWLALLEVEPNHTTTSAELESTMEVQYTTYARVEIATISTAWEYTAPTSTVKAKWVNKNAITFATPSAVGTRKVAKFFAITDVASGAGNQFVTGALASEQTINVGGEVKAAAKAIEVTFE